MNIHVGDTTVRRRAKAGTRWGKQIKYSGCSRFASSLLNFATCLFVFVFVFVCVCVCVCVYACVCVCVCLSMLIAFHLKGFS